MNVNRVIAAFARSFAITLLAACSAAAPSPTSTPILTLAPTMPPPTPTLTPVPPTPPPAEPTPIPDTLTYEQAVNLFEYSPGATIEVKERSVENFDGYTVQDIFYTAHAPGYGAAKGLTTAYVVRPEGEGPFAGILFLHWLGGGYSNRTEFLEEAKVLAQQGVVSLLIDGTFPWGIRPKDGESDRTQVIEQVVELRWALDFLLAQPGVDPQRIAYVGHDYGAIHGGVLSGVEKRVKAYVLMTGLGNFSNWSVDYFLGQTADETDYRKKMSVVEPILYVPHAAPAAILFQFAESDGFVPEPVALEFFNASSEPKEIQWYDNASHRLNEAAQQDRLAWLALQLELSPQLEN